MMITKILLYKAAAWDFVQYGDILPTCLPYYFFFSSCNNHVILNTLHTFRMEANVNKQIRDNIIDIWHCIWRRNHLKTWNRKIAKYVAIWNNSFAFIIILQLSQWIRQMGDFWRESRFLLCSIYTTVSNRLTGMACLWS